MCIGHPIAQFRVFKQGETVAEVLAGLYDRFCGCVYVSGGIFISMQNTSARQLNADDFNMFYHLEQVNGAVRFLGIPNTTEIVIPNLRIIRGEELVANQFSLLVQDSVIGRFLLPRLTQITRGNVLFQNTGLLCNYLTVLWTDIIDGSGQLIDEVGTCRSLVEANLQCE